MFGLPPRALTREDKAALAAIYSAKLRSANTAREAAEMTTGQPISDQEWYGTRDLWERNWPLVPDPYSLIERIMRAIGLRRFD